jgi:hypothetical protein
MIMERLGGGERRGEEREREEEERRLLDDRMLKLHPQPIDSRTSMDRPEQAPR